ncbi:glycosyltransferase, partial [Campylobacter lanienae]|uniref:glycosyltransferase n=2 Tax=Campylobacter lanienae TaxID=75658 RepID=UPI00112F22C4
PFPYLKRSDCFVMSSNHEGQPMTLLEALVLNIPIIATDIPGNQSILGDKYGVLVQNTKYELSKAMINFIQSKRINNNFNAMLYNKNIIEKLYSEFKDI